MTPVLRFFIAAVLLATGIGKGLDIPGFVEVIRSYRVLPEVLELPTAIGMTITELGIATWLLIGRRLARAALAAMALHVAFVGWLGLALLRGLEVENCGCFGVFLARPLTGWTVVEDLVMVAACLGLYLSRARTNARAQSDHPTSTSASPDGSPS